MFHTYYVIFSEILTLFLGQNFKTEALTAQKNQLLEFLIVKSILFVCLETNSEMDCLSIVIITKKTKNHQNLTVFH